MGRSLLSKCFEQIWGCGPPLSILDIAVIFTDASNTILLSIGQSSRYTISGYDAQSSEIVFSDFLTPLFLAPGQELRLWYMDDDFNNYTESDNGGTSCTDVFAKNL